MPVKPGYVRKPDFRRGAVEMIHGSAAAPLRTSFMRFLPNTSATNGSTRGMMAR